MGLRDRFYQFTAQSRFVVCRVFLHLAGQEVAPLLGVLNQAGRETLRSDGDMQVLGEQLARVCESLLGYETYWQSVANEGDVFWNEGEAGDYFQELFTDSAARYGSTADFDPDAQTDLAIPITQNLVVMLAVAFAGEVPELETGLDQVAALRAALKALINLHYRGSLRAIQIHFSPAQLGDALTEDHLIENFPELIPL